MFKKTKSFPLKVFWERKLNIKYDIEIEYYKKFCGASYKYKMLCKNTDLYNDSEDITYDNWKKHILETIKTLSIVELSEYSRFLNQCCRNNEMKLNLNYPFFLPCIICILGSGIVSPILDIYLSISTDTKYFQSIYDYAIILICLMIIISLGLGLIISDIYDWINNKNESYIQNFYQDTKEIVDKAIEIMNTNKSGE